MTVLSFIAMYVLIPNFNRFYMAGLMLRGCDEARQCGFGI